MKALVGAFNQEKALVGAFSVIVKTGCGTDGSICGTNHEDDQQPHVGEHGEDHRDAEHRERLDLPRLSVRNHHHAASKQTIRERQGSKDV